MRRLPLAISGARVWPKVRRAPPAEPQCGGAAASRAILELLDRLALDGWIGAGCLASLTALMLAEVFVRALSNFIPGVPANIPVAWEWRPT